jgi:hypothetical protein
MQNMPDDQKGSHSQTFLYEFFLVWYLVPKKGGKLALREKAEVIADLSSLNMSMHEIK